MNKKLLTLAVAASMAAPVAAMADAVLYGKLHMSIDYADIEDGYEGWGLNGGGSLPGVGRANRIGVKGSEDLGNGLKAIYQVEFSVEMTEEGSADADSGSADGVGMRNSFLGLAGDWGTVLVGRHDSPMKMSTGKLDLFGDTLADMNGTVGFDDKRLDNVIAYISPNFSGFQLSAATHVGGGSTVSTSTGENLNADSLAEGYSLAGIYKNGPFYASLAYESLGNELFMSTAQSEADLIDDDYNKWRLGLGLLDWNGFTLTGIYENQDLLDEADADLWQIQAGYSFGNNMVKAMYGVSSTDYDIAGVDEQDRDTWALAFDHSFSKRTSAYVLYTQVDDDVDAEDWSGFSFGMIHSF